MTSPHLVTLLVHDDVTLCLHVCDHFAPSLILHHLDIIAHLQQHKENMVWVSTMPVHQGAS